MTETTESEARRLRAAIYGEVTDLSWARLATVWTRPENIYRVQDRDGRGPWKPGFSKCWVEDRDDHDNLMPWPLQFGDVVRGKGIPGKRFGCGCLDLDQLRRWFTESEYRTLARLGYRSVQMRVDRILAQSDIQCVFERSRALRKGVQPVALYPPTERPVNLLTHADAPASL